MTGRLVIRGRMPGLNEYVRAERTSRYEAARIKREWTELAGIEAARQGLPPFDGPVEVSFLWVEPNRRRDLDNVAFAKKFVLDGLVRAGVIPDDSPRHVVGLSDRFAYDGRDPRVEVEVRDA
jgi:Holliday junction resolvase RusA-like endonuclease